MLRPQSPVDDRDAGYEADSDGSVSDEDSERSVFPIEELPDSPLGSPTTITRNGESRHPE
jgi:hypothetical protein